MVGSMITFVTDGLTDWRTDGLTRPILEDTCVSKKKKKKDRMDELVAKIKEENIVVNLSDQDIPASAYLFLPRKLIYKISSTIL